MRPSSRLPAVAPGMRIGLLGGSFDPPHAGHVHISRFALKRLGLDALWWLVTTGNPLKGAAAPLADRMQTARTLARHPKFKIVSLEAQLGSPFTADVLAFLTRRYPQVRFVWVMGADAFADLHRWRDWRTIVRLIPIAVLDRPHYRFTARSSPAARAFARFQVDERDARAITMRTAPAWTLLTLPLSDLSSTALRERLGDQADAAY